MSDEGSSRRLAFSLRTLLLVTLITILAISHWFTSNRLADAEAQVRQLRDELGYVIVDDRLQFHAVALQTSEPNTWQWRLFLPKGHVYKWNLACENIPPSTPPDRPGVMAISNEPYWDRDNEVLVTATLRENDDASWTLSVQPKIGDSQHQMAGASLTIPEEKIAWMTEVSSTDGRVLGSRGTAVEDPDGPIILLQKRPAGQRPDGSFGPSPDPMPGFMIWLSK